jgi:diacylglycerol O-acyltransferase
VTCIPVATDKDGGPRFWGNRVASIHTLLRLDIDDPIERLRAMRELTEASKEELAARGIEMYQMWSELTPPRPYAWTWRQVSRFRLADHLRPPFNLVTSNVPGPTAPLHVLGARLLSIHSVGPILEGMGLNITAWSYIDAVNFGLLSYPEAMPDLWELAAHLPNALEELRARLARPA